VKRTQQVQWNLLGLVLAGRHSQSAIRQRTLRSLSVTTSSYAALENFADYPQLVQEAYTRGVASALLYQRKETKDALNIPVWARPVYT
jgi:hypothetical protein